MKQYLKTLGAVVGIIAALVLLYLAAVYLFVFLPSFTRYNLKEADIKKYFGTEEFYSAYLKEKSWFESKKPETVSIASDDGLNLVAYSLPFDKADSDGIDEPLGTLVLMHGYHSEPVREYASLLHFYHDLGYNILLPYQRTHGLSEGKYITFGIKERVDLVAWMKKANEIFGSDKPLFVQGISMGCATAVMSLGAPDLPPNLSGVVADCGFTSPKAIIWKVLKKDKKLPTASLMLEIGDYWMRKFIGVGMEDYSTFDAIDFNKQRVEQIPILFIHGTEDEFVPIEMTEQNFARCIGNFSELRGGDLGNVVVSANPQSDRYKYIQIKDSPHAIANVVNPEKYRSEVKKFFEKYSNKGGEK